jgi:hypothetical protein
MSIPTEVPFEQTLTQKCHSDSSLPYNLTISERPSTYQLSHPPAQAIEFLHSLSMSLTADPPSLPHGLVLANALQIVAETNGSGCATIADGLEPDCAGVHARLGLLFASVEVRQESFAERVEGLEVFRKGRGVRVPRCLAEPRGWFWC